MFDFDHRRMLNVWLWSSSLNKLKKKKKIPIFNGASVKSSLLPAELKLNWKSCKILRVFLFMDCQHDWVLVHAIEIDNNNKMER